MGKENYITRRKFLRSTGIAAIAIAAQAERTSAQTLETTPEAVNSPRTPFSLRAFLPIIGVIATDVIVIGSAGYLFYRHFLRKS